MASRICCQPASLSGSSLLPRYMGPPSGSPWQIRSNTVVLSAIVAVLLLGGRGTSLFQMFFLLLFVANTSVFKTGHIVVQVTDCPKQRNGYSRAANLTKPHAQIQQSLGVPSG